MKMKLMLAALLASASLAQAGPAISPAKIKRPLRISQIKSIFHHSEPSAPARQASVPVQQAGAGGNSSTAAPVPSPVSKKVHLNPFPNHPVGSAGPK